MTECTRSALHRAAKAFPASSRRQALRWAPTALAMASAAAWTSISVALFMVHGQQSYCLTKRLTLIANTILCICTMLVSLTPCARVSPALAAGPGPPAIDQQRERYASQLFQSALASTYVTFWIWSALQSAPETPGALELLLVVDSPEDVVCYMPRSFLVEQCLTYAAVVMMLLTVAYVG